MSALLAATTGIASGVLLRSLFIFGPSVYAFVILLACLFSFGYVFATRRLYALAAVFLFCALLGMGRAALADAPLPRAFTPLLHTRAHFTGTVVGEPDVRDSSQRTPVRVSYAGSSTTVLVIAPRSPELSVGDHVDVRGTMLLPQPFASDGGRIFRYDKYLERVDIRFLLDYASVRVLAHAPWYSVPAFFARIKHTFLSGLNKALPEPYASLAGGIVIGGKSGLGSSLQNAFVRTGLVQIIVLSGYNVMVVAEWVMVAFAYIKMPLRFRAAFGAIALIIFIGVAGTSATAVRAGIMACIALYARATGKSYAASRALLFAIILMLLWHPLLATFDPGFGLSVAATAGLIWLAPRIETIFSKRSGRIFSRVSEVQRRLSTPLGAGGSSETFSKKEIFFTDSFWSNVIATTLAAQIAVLPLLLYDTGNLSLIAVPVNLLVMPLVPVTMAFSALAGFAGILLGSVSTLAASLVGLPAYFLTSGLIWIAQTAASLRLAAVSLPTFPFWLVLIAYGLLALYASAANRFSATPQLRLAKNASTYEPLPDAP